MEAIRRLMKLRAYGTAMKRCSSLLRDNPDDKTIQELFDEIADHADGTAIIPDMDKEELNKKITKEEKKEEKKEGQEETKKGEKSEKIKRGFVVNCRPQVLRAKGHWGTIH